MNDPLHLSREIQDEASGLGFDWPEITGVFAKVREEVDEIESAWRAGDREQARRELGDVAFALVNLARFLEADVAEELQRTNERFSRRFARLREELRQVGRPIETCSLEELDVIWERVKKAEG